MGSQPTDDAERRGGGGEETQALQPHPPKQPDGFLSVHPHPWEPLLVCGPSCINIQPGPEGHGVAGHGVTGLAMYPRGPMDLVPLGSRRVRCAGREAAVRAAGSEWLPRLGVLGLLSVKFWSWRDRLGIPVMKSKGSRQTGHPALPLTTFSSTKVHCQVYQGALCPKWVNACD